MQTQCICVPCCCPATPYEFCLHSHRPPTWLRGCLHRFLSAYWIAASNSPFRIPVHTWQRACPAVSIHACQHASRTSLFLPLRPHARMHACMHARLLARARSPSRPHGCLRVALLVCNGSLHGCMPAHMHSSHPACKPVFMSACLASVSLLS